MFVVDGYSGRISTRVDFPFKPPFCSSLVSWFGDMYISFFFMMVICMLFSSESFIIYQEFQICFFFAHFFSARVLFGSFCILESSLYSRLFFVNLVISFHLGSFHILLPPFVRLTVMLPFFFFLIFVLSSCSLCYLLFIFSFVFCCISLSGFNIVSHSFPTKL